MVIRLGERDLQTRFGTFREVLYYDGQRESIALVMGDVAGGEDVCCRLHSACVGGHVFSSVECTCREEMKSAQAAINAAGRGVIVYLDQEGKGNGHLALIQSIPFKAELGQAEAYVRAGYPSDARDYSAAAQILSDLQVASIVLLSNDPGKAEKLRKAGITVSSVIPATVSAAI